MPTTILGTEGFDDLHAEPLDITPSVAIPGDTLIGLGEGDWLTGSGASDSLAGGQGDDMLSGGAGFDTLSGGRGNDWLDGEGGDDWLAGGAGDDTLTANLGRDTLDGGEGADLFIAHANGSAVMHGGAGNDWLAGGIGPARNVYDGGWGNDTIRDPSAGIILFGQHSGTDTATLQQYGTTVQLDAGLTIDDLVIGGDFSSFDLNQQHLDLGLRGSSAVLRIYGYTNLRDVQLADGSSWDLMALLQRPRPVSDSDDHIVQVEAAGSGWLAGGGGQDTLSGANGLDTLTGGQGDDLLQGGLNWDVYRFGVGGGRDTVSDFDWTAPPPPNAPPGWSAPPRLAQGVRIELSGVNTIDQLRFVQDGQDLVIGLLAPTWAPTPGATDWSMQWLPTSDELRVSGYFGVDQRDPVIYIRANGADVPWSSWSGEALTPQDIAARLQTAPPTVGSGTNAPDIIELGWAADQVILAGSGDDTIDIGHGGGKVVGEGGHDTYRWGLLSQSTVIEPGTSDGGWEQDTVEFGAGIQPGDLLVDVVRTEGRVGWRLSLSGHSSTLTLMSYTENDPFYRVPLLQFADGDHPGALLDANWLRATWLRQHPDIAHWMQGGADTLAAGQNTAGVAFGGGGSDTYIVSLDNDLRVVAGTSDTFGDQPAVNLLAYGHSDEAVDTVQFTGGIRPQDLRVLTRDTYWPEWPAPSGVPTNIWPRMTHDLVLQVRDTDREVALRDQAWTAPWNLEADQFTFDDGTVWTHQQVLEMAARTRASGEVVRGSTQADRIDGLDGDDLIWGGAGRDTLLGSEGRDELYGEAGNDLLQGAWGDDLLDGGDDHDNLQGGDGRDTLMGGTGKDTLDGGADADLLAGGLGNDVYLIDTAADVIQEHAGEGRDQVRVTFDYTAPDNGEVVKLLGSGDWRLPGRATASTALIGNDGANWLQGGTASDSFSGLLGADTLIGDDGGDFYTVFDNEDEIVEAEGHSGLDVLITLTEGLTLPDNVEVMFLKGPAATSGFGNDGDNLMYGNDHGCLLMGSLGDDQLMGGQGNDTLNGDTDNDTLEGGLGNDDYFGGRGHGADVITEGGGDLDILRWGASNINQVWFERQGNDLLVSNLGSGDSTRVQGHFAATANQIDFVKAGSRFITSANIDQLIATMATVAKPTTSLSQLSSADQARILNAESTLWQ